MISGRQRSTECCGSVTFETRGQFATVGAYHVVGQKGLPTGGLGFESHRAEFSVRPAAGRRSSERVAVFFSFQARFASICCSTPC